MLLKEILDIYNLLDSAHADGNSIKTHLLRIRSDANVEVVPIVTPKGSTDIIRILVKGKNGRSQNGTAPTIGLMGWLGGIGARPDAVGYVSDGDGALAALSVAAKLLDMQNKGDFLEGDVYLATRKSPLFCISRIKATSWKAMFIWLPISVLQLPPGLTILFLSWIPSHSVSVSRKRLLLAPSIWMP